MVVDVSVQVERSLRAAELHHVGQISKTDPTGPKYTVLDEGPTPALPAWKTGCVVSFHTRMHSVNFWMGP